MASLKIKKGDTVRVIAGKDRDKEGKAARNQQGGIVKKEAPIDISNVMYLHKGQPTRIGFKFEGDKKVRVAKSTGETIE